MNTTRQQHDVDTCLACNEKPPQKAEKRGLCTSCYEKMRRQRDLLPKDAHSAFEQRLIAMGKLLPDARAPKNLFADVRMEMEAEMVAENTPPYVAKTTSVGKRPPKPQTTKPAVKQTRAKKSGGA